MKTRCYETSFFVVCKCPGCRDTINYQMPAPRDSSCNKCPGFARGGMLAAGIDSHIISCCENLCVQWSSTYNLIYPSKLFNLTGTYFFYKNIFSFIRLNLFLLFFKTCSMSVFNLLVFLCGFLLCCISPTSPCGLNGV